MALLDPTQAELLKPKKLKKSKYAAKRVKIDGLHFDSRVEGARYCELKLLEKSGSIHELGIHPKYKFRCGRVYVADFYYIYCGDAIVEDVKGFRTAVYRLKKAMMLEEYGIEIKEVNIDPERADLIIKAYLGGAGNVGNNRKGIQGT